MSAQLRPNRLVINDRFPMLGFTIRTDGSPQKAEITIATDLALFDAPSRRTSNNFFSTRELGALSIPKGEAVYVVPPEIIARFIGGKRLYFALATTSMESGDVYEVQIQPTEDSPYVSIRDLTGRSLRRVRMFPQRGVKLQQGNGYGSEGNNGLQWAGDTPTPRMEAINGSNTNEPPSTNSGRVQHGDVSSNNHNNTTSNMSEDLSPSPTTIDYDDGFGPLPESPTDNSSDVSTAEGLALIKPDYKPNSFTQALQFMWEWMTRHTRWRASVPDTTISPHSAICQFKIKRPSGTYIGTGFYIAPDRILTCAHNVIDWDEGREEATHIIVTPGLNDTNEPFGSFRVNRADWEYHPSYDGSYNFDLAVLRVTTPPPNGYYFEGLEALDISVESPMVVCGYGAVTGDEEKQNMEGDTIRALSNNMERFQYNINTEPGNSGSPVYYVYSHEDEARQQSVLAISVVGVHVSAFDDRLNQGCRLTQDKINWIWDVAASTNTTSQGLSSSSQNSYVNNTSSPQELAHGMGFDPYAVEVKYRMFIPSPVINGPPLLEDFGGDGRGFAYNGGTSRGEITAMVHLTGGMGIERVDVDPDKRHWGESTAYSSDDTFHVSGKPDWWLDKRTSAQPTRRETLADTDDNLNVIAGLSGRSAIQAYLEHASAVTITAAGALPLVPLSPDIDAEVSVLFRNLNGLIQAKAVGRHDGFPAHELYVNGLSIYRYDPVATGNSPSALVGYGDIDVNSDWTTVARTNIVRIGGQAIEQTAQAQELNESFTVNWDEVQSIAQPTNDSCWAAAGAMVVGWRDQMSLSPGTIAEITGRTTTTGLNPAEVGQFAEDLGLLTEAPQSYSQQGFRQLLEDNGPLWVGAAVPSLHAIVVTGIYNDDTQLYVRITDPWDRTVGTPGSPGSYANTHVTGSRYILRWEDFVAEYEAATTNYSAVNLQILHSGGTQGRTPNRGVTTPPGYAQNLPQDMPEELPQNIIFAETVTNLIPPEIHPVEKSSEGDERLNEIWSILTTKSFGAEVSNKLSDLPALAIVNGWTIAASLAGRKDLELNHIIGSGVGIGNDQSLFHYYSASQDMINTTQKNVTIQNASGQNTLLITIISGGTSDFTSWSRMKPFTTSDSSVSFGALLLNNLDLPVGMAFLLGIATSTDLKSRITTIVDSVQAAHSASMETPEEAPVSQPIAQHLSHAVEQPARDTNNTIATLPGVPRTFPPSSVKIFRSKQESNGINYDLFSMDGSVTPQTPPQIAQDLIAGEQVLLTEWPYIEGQNGRTQGGVAIDWFYGAGAVANVRVTPSGGQIFDGWQVSVRADIDEDSSTSLETKLKVSVYTTFTRNGQDSQIGVSEVTLSGSGELQTAHHEEQQPAIAVA